MTVPSAAPAPPAPSPALSRVALFGRYGTPSIAEPLARIAKFVTARGHHVVLEADTASLAAPAQFGHATLATSVPEADVAIVVGGDGTMLAIAQQLAPHGVPLIGINRGRVGFLTDIPLTKMEDALGEILAGRYIAESRHLLEMTLRREDATASTAIALNEVVVGRGPRDGMIDCAVDVDGHFVCTLRSDGIIIATPTGSTAYSLSAMGPIVHPDVPAVLLVPVAPHALTNRPIVISDNSVVTVTLLRGREATCHCDGQGRFDMHEGESIVVRRSAHVARFLHPEGHDHFAVLRQKLHWSETPERLRSA